MGFRLQDFTEPNTLSGNALTEARTTHAVVVTGHLPSLCVRAVASPLHALCCVCNTLLLRIVGNALALLHFSGVRIHAHVRPPCPTWLIPHAVFGMRSWHTILYESTFVTFQGRPHMLWASGSQLHTRLDSTWYDTGPILFDFIQTRASRHHSCAAGDQHCASQAACD